MNQVDVAKDRIRGRCGHIIALGKRYDFMRNYPVEKEESNNNLYR